jgi:hypothetical protein
LSISIFVGLTSTVFASTPKCYTPLSGKLSSYTTGFDSNQGTLVSLFSRTYKQGTYTKIDTIPLSGVTSGKVSGPFDDAYSIQYTFTSNKRDGMIIATGTLPLATITPVVGQCSLGDYYFVGEDAYPYIYTAEIELTNLLGFGPAYQNLDSASSSFKVRGTVNTCETSTKYLNDDFKIVKGSGQLCFSE